ncbi:MAG: hypothetical protein AB7J28_13065 [Hyphomonadaceae bacterium]
MKTLADWAPLLEEALDKALSQLSDNPEDAGLRAQAVSAGAKAVREVLALNQSAAQTQEEDDEAIRVRLEARLDRFLEYASTGDVPPEFAGLRDEVVSEGLASDSPRGAASA